MTIRTEILAASVVRRPELAESALRIPGFRVPRSLSELEAPSERFLPEERAELAGALESHLAPLAPPVAVLDSVRALAP